MSRDDCKSIGDRVGWLRVRKPLYVNELALLAGLSNGYVSRLETGARKDANATNIAKLADVLEASVEWIITGRGDPQDATPPTTKPNLEQTIKRLGSKRWTEEVLDVARAIKEDRTLAAWPRALDILQKTLKQI